MEVSPVVFFNGSLWFRGIVPEEGTITDDGMLKAVSASRSIEGFGYSLTDRGVLNLARCYSAGESGINLNKYFERQYKAGMLSGADFGSHPLIAGFPEEVLGMSEAKYRFIQILHYCSTYGLKEAGYQGVPQGWLPQTGEEGDYSKQQEKYYDHMTVIDILTDKEAYNQAVKLMSSARRLNSSEIESVVEVLLYCIKAHPGYYHKEDFKPSFKEDGAVIIKMAMEKNLSSLELEAFLWVFTTNPTDALKILDLRRSVYREGGTNDLFALQNRFHADNTQIAKMPTRYKKAFVRVLDLYGEEPLMTALADASKELRYSIRRISYKRFTVYPERVQKIESIMHREVRGFNSQLQRVFRGLESGTTTMEGAKRVLSLRPGVVMRELRHLVRVTSVVSLVSKGVNTVVVCNEAKFKELEQLVRELSVGMSPMNLVRICTKFSMQGDVNVTSVMTGEHVSYAKVNPLQLQEENRVVLRLIRVALQANLAANKDERIAGKKVYLNKNDVSLESSLVLLNDVGENAGSVYPAGIALEMPANINLLRFFLFWQDTEKQVDLDLHAYLLKEGGAKEHIGWNSRYREGSAVYTSGDVTTSFNPAEEYIDVDFGKAKEKGIKGINIALQDYTHEEDGFAGVQKALFGVEALEEGTRKERLYDPKNVVFQEDLNSKGTDLQYAYVNIDNKALRFMRGVSCAGEYAYSLKDYLDDIIEAWGVNLVDSVEQADVVVSLGKVKDSEAIDMLKENFFLGK